MDVLFAFAIGLITGAVTGFLTNLLAWWILTHYFVPRIEFSSSISKMPTPQTPEDRSGYRYRVRLQNSGRRNVIDVEIAARLLITGLSRHSKELRGVVEIPQKADGTTNWGISRMLPARKGGTHPVMFLHINSALELREWRMFPEQIRGKSKEKILVLEDLLRLGEEATIRYRAFCYDEFSGARKVFFSKPYTFHDIKEGLFEEGGLDIVDTT